MYRDYRIKPRINKLEERTKEMLLTTANIVQLYQRENFDIVEVTKKYAKANVLFEDCTSPYKTFNNNPRITEFVLFCPQWNINWRIECKSQQKVSDLITRVFYELDCVTELKENKLILVLEGAFNLPSVKNKLNDKIIEYGLQKRVWFGSLEEFEQKILKRIKKYS